MGEFCPVPTLKTIEKLSSMQPGETLTVIVDHSCAVENIREALRRQLRSFEVKEVANGIWELTLVKR